MAFTFSEFARITEGLPDLPEVLSMLSVVWKKTLEVWHKWCFVCQWTRLEGKSTLFHTLGCWMFRHILYTNYRFDMTFL